jgi:hypothetical protein
MATPFGFESRGILRRDEAFVWHEVEEGVLQVASSPTITPEDAAEVLLFWERLLTVRNEALLTPARLLRDGDAVAALYEPFVPAVSATWEELGEIAEALFDLHKADLGHGALSSDSLVRGGTRIKLAHFGWMPLLERRPPPRGAYVAPEHGAGGTSPLADQFGFGHLAAHLSPGLAHSEWFATATHPDPGTRYRRMRECRLALPEAEEVSVASGGLVAAGVLEEIEIVEPKPTAVSIPIQPDAPRILAIIRAEVIPADAGTVWGAGSYDYGSEVKLSFVANPGYRFRRWMPGGETTSRLTVVAKDDLRLTAEAEAVPVRTRRSLLPVVALLGLLGVGWAGFAWSGMAMTKEKEPKPSQPAKLEPEPRLTVPEPKAPVVIHVDGRDLDRREWRVELRERSIPASDKLTEADQIYNLYFDPHRDMSKADRKKMRARALALIDQGLRDARNARALLKQGEARFGKPSPEIEASIYANLSYALCFSKRQYADEFQKAKALTPQVKEVRVKRILEDLLAKIEYFRSGRLPSW